ncbi:hypothetical protein BHM03_00050837, partial [Ensete ventricosum]
RNLPGVRRELAEGIRSLPRWRKEVHQKKVETRRKIVGGSRKACRDLPRPHPPSAGVDQDDAGYYTTQSTIGTPVSAPATGAQIVRLDTLTHQEDPLPPDVPMLRDSASLPRSSWEPKKP